jgi:DNA-binding LacI/PurR family transcriptional regulator
MPSRRVTIRDVSAHAGVSATTVSHVLSGQGRVSAETRRRVQRAVHDLGYRANPLARNLRQDRFGAVGLYLPEPNLSLQFYVDLALAASRAAFARGCGLTLLPPRSEAPDLLDLPLDGVIVAEPVVDDPVVAALADRQTPLVLCEAAQEPTGPRVRVVDNSHDVAMAELLDHLVDRGADDIVVVGADPSVWWGRLTRAAVEAWCARHARRVRWVSMPFACGLGEARRQVDALLDESVPDALVIGQQGLASAVLASAAARGLAVPRDLLLACGVDGPDLLTTSPTVTALDLQPKLIGDLAVELVLESGRASAAALRPPLRVRGSTGG